MRGIRDCCCIRFTTGRTDGITYRLDRVSRAANRACGATTICGRRRSTSSESPKATRTTHSLAHRMSPNRIALVTGGTRGIGLGIARALASDGWTLALCGLRSREEVADIVKQLGSRGGGAEYWRADVGSPNDRALLLS